MATKIAKATGNLTDATGTWGVADSTSLLFNVGSALATTATTTSFVASQTSTPGAITIDGIAIRIASRSSSPNGTFSVDLFNSTDSAQVAGTQVDVNVSDLPAENTINNYGIGWLFFKFASPITLTAGKAYSVRVKSSVSSQVTVYRNGTAGNWLRALRTTTEAAPAAGDTLVISKQYTGAGASTAVTITMDSTSSTDYGDASTSTNDGSLFIADGCTFKCGTSASTNYVFRISGNVWIGRGATFSYGSSGDPVPRSSTAVFEFDLGASGDFRFRIAPGSTFNTEGQSRSSGKNIVQTKLTANMSAAGTSLSVADDTGWLSGDIIMIAATGITFTQTEQKILNGDASSSSMSITVGVTNAHNGTSPNQAEVGLITRNVQFRSTNVARLWGFDLPGDATISSKWTRYTSLGDNLVRGFEFGGSAATAAKVWDFCSFDAFVFAILLSTTFSNHDNYEITNCIAYAASGVNTCLLVRNALDPPTNIKINNNLLFGNTSTSSIGVSFEGKATQCNNNTCVGFGYGLRFGVNTWGSSDYLTMTGNVVHSNYRTGFHFSGGRNRGLKLSGGAAYRNGDVSTSSLAASNIYFESQPNQVWLHNIDIWDGNVANISIFNESYAADVLIDSCNLERVSGANMLYNIAFNDPLIETGIRLVKCNMDGSSGIASRTAPSTNHFGSGSGATNHGLLQVALDYCKTGSLALAHANTLAYLGNSSYIRSSHDNSTAVHRTISRYGTAQRNTSVYNTASPSQELMPASASLKLEGSVAQLPVDSGEAINVQVAVRKTSSYNGNAPRLILRRNDALGVSSDTVLDTMSVGADTWEVLTGTTPTASADGVFEVFVDCDGTAGSIYLDDMARTA